MYKNGAKIKGSVAVTGLFSAELYSMAVGLPDGAK
jgi:hypothetical protein